jgi:hypothetical protein
MATIDLRSYVVGPTGKWFHDLNNYQPDLLRLTEPSDGLTLVGPLRVRVCVQALNRFTLIATASQALQARELMSYVLDLPPGQAWTYPAPFEQLSSAGSTSGTATLAGGGGSSDTLTLLRDAPQGAGSGGGGLSINTNTNTNTNTNLNTAGAPALAIDSVANAYTATVNAALWRRVWGANAGAAILIRPAGPDMCGDPCACEPNPCAPNDQCAPKKSCGCGCSCSPCHCGGSPDDIPCDFAVRNRPDAGSFFPSSCEPCTPGAPVAMPPTKGPALLVKPAAGGTIRTRFYNGMHIGKEDFETDQKNVRIKRALMNRALGQGVAWGFGLGFDGNALCVQPGYGLDCCGADVILSSAYRVDATALAADPAAAQLVAMRGPQRASLVLEYFECPQEPRPVHGDPCANDGGRCEPSRIRETARLRLAPPCNLDDSGPIRTFLAEIEKLRNDPVVGPFFQSGPCAPPFSGGGTGTGTGTGPQLSAAPITVKLEAIARKVGDTTSDGFAAGASNAVPAPSPTEPAQGDAFLGSPLQAVAYSVRITVTADPGYRFTQQGQVAELNIVTGQPDGNAIPLYAHLTSDGQIVWEIPMPATPLALQQQGQDPIPPQFTERFSGWELTDASNNHVSGSIEPSWTLLAFHTDQNGSIGWDSSKWGRLVEQGSVPSESVPASFDPSSVIHLSVPPATLSSSGGKNSGPFPCLSEACDPNSFAFWNTFPFLHANPQDPCQAADWRVLVLGVLYVSLSAEMVRSGYGTPQYVQSAALEAASAAYSAASKLYFGTMPDTDRFSLTDAIQKLLQAWCKSLLYPGPSCRCSPHGVVIGCAVVEGGTIAHVDPWGGRRWVVQYPLLSYWGQQFGLMPLDAIASRLFDMICCFSSLPAPKFSVAGNAAGDITTRPLFRAPGIRPTERVSGRDSMIQFGPATLLAGDPSTIAQRVQMLGATRTETLNPLDFVSRVTAMIGAAGSAPPGAPLVDYAVRGFPDVHFVTPDPSGSATNVSQPAGGRAGAAASTGLTSDQPLFGRFIANEVAGLSGAEAPPRLLRPLVASLSYSIAASLPLAPPQPLATPLTTTGLDTIGKLLDRDPETTLATSLNGQNADLFSQLLDDAEKTARTVVKVAGDSVVLAAGEKQLTSRADLKTPATAASFTKLLQEQLKTAKLDVPTAAVASAVSEATEMPVP